MKLDPDAEKKYNYTWLAQPVIKLKMKEHTATYREVANRYDKKSQQF